MSKKLYPDIEPYNSGWLNVSDLHEIYYEESGNPNGLPVVRLHGGPGASSKPDHRRHYNPEVFRIIMFDQRGAGKSKPSGELQENTTQDLIKDIEKLREHLGVDTWIVDGRSWGSTLGFAYCIEHPSHVMEFITGGVWLGTKEESDWMYKSAKKIYPEEWDRFVSILSEKEKKDVKKAICDRILSEDEETRNEAVRAFMRWDLRLLRLHDFEKKLEESDDIPFDDLMTSYRIFAHYESNNVFLKDNEILEKIKRISDIPVIIVQGQLDMITPPESAWKVHSELPKSILHMMSNAGHSTDDPGMMEKVLKVNESIANRESRTY